MVMATGVIHRSRAAGIRGSAAAEIETIASAGSVPSQNPVINSVAAGTRWRAAAASAAA